MPRFPILTILLIAVAIYGLWGLPVLFGLALALIILAAYQIGRAEQRADSEREREADFQRLLEPTDEEIEQLERDRGWRD